MAALIARLNAALEGRYQIERQLGEGGMATVYLADDLKHERRVALKVLKPELAAVVGADRFLAEIKTTANLHHPHILPLFDSGEADGFLFYVMPYVEGETLRERLDRERQLPLVDALAIATAIAQALQHAHDRGVIHRDIKPGNILMQDGQPVVSDFGIALAVGSAGGARLTETGLSVGTPFYMSPEQATGDQIVGPASDIYAVGCVLYEMLTGDPPYIGSTAQAVLGKIIQGAPVSATATRSSVPANVDAAIRRALEKLPADRFPSAKEFAKALGDPGFRHGTAVAAAAGAGLWKRVAIAASAVAVLLLGVAVATLTDSPEAPARSAVRFTIPVDPGDALFFGGAVNPRYGRPSATSLALSPDGGLLVYAAWDTAEAGRSQLYLRRLGDERPDPVPGTEGATSSFFSPDGEWLGFYASGALRRVRVTGGSAETIVADAQGGRAPGATWGDDGTIVYKAPDGLYRVSESGGEPELVVAESDSVPFLTQPHFLPGSRVLLFTAWPRWPNPEAGEIRALDLATREQTLLISDAMDARFVDSGYLLFIRRGTLLAVRFDPGRIAVSGQPFIVQEVVMQAIGMPNSGVESGVSQVAVTPAGHLAYVSGGVYPGRVAELVRVSADGAAEPLNVPSGDYIHVRVSPDGERIAFNVRDGWATSIRVHDLVRSVTTSLNTGGFISGPPTWSPDGRSLAFDFHREGGDAYLARVPAAGGGEPERLVPSSQADFAFSWSADGVLAYEEGDDIWLLPPDGPPSPFFTSSDAREAWATFSPDGRWLAYASNQTGSFEVYVRPHPGPGPATRVSSQGAAASAWSRDGRRLYILRGPTRPAMMVADVTTEPDFRVDRMRTLIDPWPYRATVPVRSHDVLPDGSFVAVREVEEDPDTRLRAIAASDIHVVLNFADELRRREQR